MMVTTTKPAGTTPLQAGHRTNGFGPGAVAPHLPRADEQGTRSLAGARAPTSAGALGLANDASNGVAPGTHLQHSRHLRRTGAPASPSSSTGARRRAAAPVAGLDCVSMRRCRGLAARDCRWPRLTLVAQDHGARGRPDAPSAAALHALYPWPPVRTCRRIPRTPAPSMPTAPAPSSQATTAHSATARHSRQRR
ncbi:hypothetical protein ZWY2020_022125 [Hordeum vulgare]|nr:hypothetical protein ZWY2020_022125 [Hordeum vulgare]